MLVILISFVAIDEEINTMMKVFDADQKRLKSILQNYEDKQSDLGSTEKRERNNLVEQLKDCSKLFNMAFTNQTERHKQNQTDIMQQTRYENETNVSKIREDTETVNAFIEKGKDKHSNKEDLLDFDGHLNQIVTFQI